MDTGQGKHCENPPRDFLSDVDCEKKRRLSFLKSARDEVKSGLKFQDWHSQRFSLFGSLIETLEKKLDKGKGLSINDGKWGLSACQRKVNW